MILSVSALTVRVLIQKKSKNMLLRVDGALGPGVGAKDLILAIIGHIGTAGRHPRDCKQARGIVTRKPGVATQGVNVHLNLVTELLKALDTAPESGFVADSAGGGEYVNMTHMT